MRTPLVLTVIGDDHPGLVSTLSDTIAAFDGNWTETRMASLGGKFAGILLVTVPQSKADALIQALRQLEGQSLHLAIGRSTAEAPPGSRLLVLDLIGQDRPGIVRDISHVLAQLGINIEELETACVKWLLFGRGHVQGAGAAAGAAAGGYRRTARGARGARERADGGHQSHEAPRARPEFPATATACCPDDRTRHPTAARSHAAPRAPSGARRPHGALRRVRNARAISGRNHQGAPAHAKRRRALRHFAHGAGAARGRARSRGARIAGARGRASTSASTGNATPSSRTRRAAFSTTS